MSCDLRLILKMSASNKGDWLEKALKAMMAGKTKVQDVFNIVTHPKFASGVSEKYGKRMFQMVTENMDQFSDKQRLTLSRCKLASGNAKEEDSEDEAKIKRRRRSRSRSHARSTTASPPRPQSGNPQQEDDDGEDSKRQEEEKRRVEAQKRKMKEQEAKRKAKLGSAFQFEPEDEAESTKKQLQNKLDKASRKEELPSLALAWGSGGRDADPRFVEAMGGDKLLQEAHKILRHAAGSGRIDSRRSRSRRSRSRRRNRERSRSPKRPGGPHVRSSGSYRSPTPDGRARGQARAARKAKMIASLMGIKR